MINNSNFIISEKDIPKVPIDFSEESLMFWREQKKRCINGYWSSGRFMPGPLYFYVNFWHIKHKVNNQEITIRPLLRDIEWEWFRYWMEARGFSTFSDLKDIDIVGMSPREILFKDWGRDVGYPIYGNQAQNLMVIAARGVGKDLHEDTVIYTERGKKKIKECSVGEYIYGADGKLTMIKDVIRFNDQLQYKITLRDGRSILAGSGHLWCVNVANKDEKEILTTKEIHDNYVLYRNNGRTDYRYSIDYCKPIEYKEKALDIDPYFLGIWLGDGSSGRVGITTLDDEIKDVVFRIAESISAHVNINVNNKKTCPTYFITNGKGRTTSLRSSFIKYNLFNNKHIPDVYKMASIDQRIELIRGLMDSDGYISEDGDGIEFSNKNKTLIYDVSSVLSSLGIKNTISERTTSYNGKSFKSYRINIRSNINIFKLKRKASRFHIPKSKYAETNRMSSKIVGVEPIAIMPSVCIAVDNEDKLFVAGDYITTHNSYVAASLMAHEWLFDGAKYYDGPESLEGLSTEIVVGAGEAFYSKTLLDKVQFGLKELPGGISFNNKWYAPPFSKQYSGSWIPGKNIKAEYLKKLGGTWKPSGTGSTIKHRTFKDNPYAANGTRPNVLVLEEAGLFPKLEGAHNASKEMMRIAGVKFGSELVIGTGGDMKGGTVDAYKMFYAPESYDMLVFNDEWEGKGSIGYFIPAYRYMQKYMDENNVCDEIAAKEELIRYREELKKKANTAGVMDDELQNRPLKPSEAFLQTSSNLFPIADIQEWLSTIETKKIYQDAEMVCSLVYNEDGVVVPRIDKTARAIRKFPLNTKDDIVGAVTIFHHPETVDDGKVHAGRYIAGLDPYDIDRAENSKSLGSLIVLDRLTNDIVCEYSGRPLFTDQFYENCRRILTYYNAVCLYENEKPGVKQYFERKNSLNLLMRQPLYLKDVIPNSTVERQYGMHMTTALMDHGEILLRDWLQEEYESGKTNVTKIRSVPVLKELLFYDSETGNYDRVIAMVMCMYALQEMHKVKVDAAKENSQYAFFNRKIFQRKAIMR